MFEASESAILGTLGISCKRFTTDTDARRLQILLVRLKRDKQQGHASSLLTPVPTLN